MKMKKFIKAVALAVCLTMAAPVVAPSVGIETVEAATKVKLNCTKKTIYEGDSFKLKITGTKKKVKWSSSNKRIATVSSKGSVRGVSNGSCKIKASVGNKKYYCKVTVKEYESIDYTDYSSRVTYIGDRSVQYVSNANIERFFFSLKDQYQKRMASDGTVDLRIENNGVVVYQKTIDFTIDNFGYWTNGTYGERYLCSIDIPISEIQQGKYDKGILYYRINEKSLSFDEYSLNISNLPKEQRKIDVDTISYIPDQHNPDNKIQIIDYSIDGNKICLTCKMVQVGEKGKLNYGAYIYQYDKYGNVLNEDFIYTSQMIDVYSDS